MPATSIKQRRLAAIAEHHPEMLYARNRGMAQMSKDELHKFVSTKEKGLPLKRRKRMSGISYRTKVNCSQANRRKTMSMNKIMI